MEGLDAKMRSLSATFENFATNLVSSDLVKTVIDLAKAFLELADTGLGRFVTQIILLSSLGWGAQSLLRISNVVSNVIGSWKTFGSLIANIGTYSKIANDAGIGLNRTIQIMTGSAVTFKSIALPVLTLISTAIVGISTAIGAANRAQEEARQYAIETSNTYLDQVDALESLKDQYIDAIDNIEDETEKSSVLADIKKQLVEEYGYEEAALDNVINKREQFIETLTEEQRQRAKNAMAAIQQEYDKATDYYFSGYEGSVFENFVISILEIDENSLEKAQKAIDDLGIKLKGNWNKYGEFFLSFKLDESKITNAQEAVDAFSNALLAIDALRQNDPTGYYDELYDVILDRLRELNSELGEYEETLNTGNKATVDYFEAMIDGNAVMFDGKKYIIDSKEAYDEFIEAVKGSNETSEVQNGIINVLSNTFSEFASRIEEVNALYSQYSNKMDVNNAKIQEINQSMATMNLADTIKEVSSAIDGMTSDLENYGAIGSDALSGIQALVPNLTDDILAQQMGIEGLDGALFNANGTLTDSGQAAFDASDGIEAFAEAIVQAQIAINSMKIEELNSEIETVGDKSWDLAIAARDTLNQYGKDSQQYLDAYQEFYDVQSHKSDLDVQKKELEALQQKLESIDFSKIFTGSGGGGGGGSARKQADEVKDVLSDLKDWLEDKDHQIFLLEKNQQVAEDQELLDEAQKFADQRANIIKNNMTAISNWADNLRAQGFAEDSEQIQELQKLWWQYHDELSTIYDDLDAQREENAEKEKERIEQEKRDRLEAAEERLSKEKEAYEALADYMVDRIDEEIDAIDAKIDALDEQNDKLQDQIELEEKLDALARAKSKKVLVYKDGRYQYVSDIDAVSDAQADLEEYEREQALEEQKNALEEEKEILEQYKDEWGSLTNKYKEEQDALLLEQYFGINTENDNWEKRLDNFQDFYDEYAKLCYKLAKLQEELQDGLEETNRLYEAANNVLNNASSVIGGVVTGMAGGLVVSGGNLVSGMIGSAIGGALGVADAMTGGSSNKGSSSSGSSMSASGSSGNYQIGSEKGQNFVNNAKPGSTMIGGDGSKWTKNPDGSTTISKGGNTWTVSGYANGTLSASDDISVVGENGPELRVLNKGDGIIPANVTKNLWSWGSINPASFFDKVSSGTSVVIQNLNLPNVRDPQDFAQYLKDNFWRKTVQFQTSKT